MYVEDKIIILNLWDTAGQERFKSLIPSYIKDAAVAIVVFDVTNKQSFTSVDKWIEDARSLREDDVLLILAGNKCDLGDQRQVSQEEAQSYAKEKDLMYFETSARQGTNIKSVFNALAKKLTGIETNPMGNEQEKVINGGFNLGDKNKGDGGNQKGKKKKGTCC